MKELHLIHARQAQPFMKVLRERRAPVRKLAAQADLPYPAIRDGVGVVGESALWRFVENAAQQERLPDFGYLCAEASPVVNDGKLGVMPILPRATLQEILEQFFQDARSESTGSQFRLDKGRFHSWIKRTPRVWTEKASWQVEQYMIQVFIQIVRICAGLEWLPAEIGVHSSKTAQAIPAEWHRITISWGAPETSLKLANRLLNLPPVPFDAAVADFASAENELHIKQLVERQLAMGKPSLEAAARELGVSPATLKRKLKRRGTAWSHMIRDARLRLARTLLLESDIAIREISHDLGYRHPGNFVRAFQKLEGVSPGVFRQMSRMSSKGSN